jgi:hypothetical protein
MKDKKKLIKNQKIENINNKSIIKKYIDNIEKNSQIIDIYTGLRNYIDINSAEFNWTTYICLSYKNKQFSKDIMNIINEYLNWIPAGCWSKKYYKSFWNNDSIYKWLNHKCICGIKIINYSYFIDDNEYTCSIRCHEELTRHFIYEDYERYSNYCKQLKNELSNNNSKIEIDEYYIYNIF